MKKTKIFILAIAAVATLGAISFISASSTRKPKEVFAEDLVKSRSKAIDTAKEQYSKTLMLREDDISFGQQDAPVKIVEYASLSCVHCGMFFRDVFPRLKESYIDKGKVHFIYRDFPTHIEAAKAVMMLRCKKRSEKEYHRMLKALYTSQESWLVKNYIEKLETIGKLSGIPGEEFHKCIENKDLETKILDSRVKDGQDLEINSTPTIFIDGIKLSGSHDYKSLSEAIDGRLSGEVVSPADSK